MKRFHFPLERVRRWRSEQVSLEELKLQQLRSELARLTRLKLEVEAEASESARLVLAQPAIDPIELTSLESYKLHLRRRVYELDNLRRQCEAKVSEQLERVLEARRQFELLDRLHEKARREWVAEGNKEQEQLAAELFLAKAVREQ
jgi:flagellar biosynthesis chaperone FliJ